MLNKLYERVQNKEKRCTMMELGYWHSIVFITIIVFELFSKQTKKRNLISNSLFWKSSIGIYYAKNFKEIASLVEHNDVLAQVIKANTKMTKDLSEE
jgi:hypothetical protein